MVLNEGAMCDAAERHAEDALEHLRHFTVHIGPRPSTQDGEHRAAQYAAEVMRASGLQDVRCEQFHTGRSTYQPYAMAIGAGLVGNLMYLLSPKQYALLAAALLNGLGGLGFFQETNFDDNWMRRLLPRYASQNVIGVVGPSEERRTRAVLVAHLDSHRTPIFYGNSFWAQIFSPLTAAVLASLGVSSIAAVRGLASKEADAEWVHYLATALQILGLSLLLHADSTPYAVGANDNASGAATVLALGKRLAKKPLRHTEVWVVNTGCEEVGAGGIQALLRTHGDALRQAYFLNFDMVGIGSPAVLTREGLLRSYRPDPGLLELARTVSTQHPGWVAGEHKGGAYTDMGVVIKHGFRGLVIDSIVPEGHPAKKRMGYWHQSEDTYTNIERDCLVRAHSFGWAILQSIDQQVA